MPRIGQGVAGCVAQHVGVGLEAQLGGFASPQADARLAFIEELAQLRKSECGRAQGEPGLLRCICAVRIQDER